MQEKAESATQRARRYTAKRKLGLQLYGLALFGVPVIFVVCGASLYFATLGLILTRNLYLSVGLVWAALYATMFAVNLPIAAYRYRVDRQFDLARTGLKQYLLDACKANAIGFVSGLAVVEVVFAIMNLPGEYTWLLAAAAVSLIYAAFVYLVPGLMPMFYRMAQLSDQVLVSRLRMLAQRAGVHIAEVYEWHISARTRKANALVAGFGKSRKVVLTDTLIEHFSVDEIEALIAHEFGHCAHNDIFKRVLWRTAMFVPVLWAVQGLILYQLVPMSAGGWSNPAVVPIFWVLWLALTVYGNLVITAVARKQERAADRFALELIPSAAAFISAMNKATSLNLVIYEKKSEWKYAHPATSERIAAAEKFARERGQALEPASEAVIL